MAGLGLGLVGEEAALGCPRSRDNCELKLRSPNLEAPNITCPDNITVETDPGNTAALVDWMVPLPTDNVELTKSSPVADPDRQPPTAIAITLESPQTYTARDTAGNSASCTFFITVEGDIDKEPPLIANCPLDMNLSTSAGVNYTVAEWTEPTVTDDAGTPNLTSTHSVGSEFYIGKTVVIYTAVDSFDNTATCKFTICVQDKEKPNLVCPNKVLTDQPDSVNWRIPKPEDNSGLEVTLKASASPDGTWEVGEHSVTYNATDVYGNLATCSFMVSVIDACVGGEKNCENGGICSANDFKCVCPNFYSGELCENEP
ncbi:hyalin-like, partial [Anneissia japonica]|uniref:hyalin-like n=1 Tax=Anneissia japonica TaxID=1529436 RepID=UPI001425792C